MLCAAGLRQMASVFWCLVSSLHAIVSFLLLATIHGDNYKVMLASDSLVSSGPNRRGAEGRFTKGDVLVLFLKAQQGLIQETLHPHRADAVVDFRSVCMYIKTNNKFSTTFLFHYYYG